MNPQLVNLLRKITTTTIEIGVAFAIAAALRKTIKKTIPSIKTANNFIDDLFDQDLEDINLKSEIIKAAKIIGVALTVSIVSAVIASYCSNVVDAKFFNDLPTEA